MSSAATRPPAHAAPRGRSVSMDATGKRSPITSGKPSLGYRITGVIGELMITLGVLLAAFLVWQLWWTDVVAEQQQREMIAELPWQAPAPDPITSLPTGPAPVMAEPEEEGTVFATLFVPRWGEDYQRTIAQGVNKKQVLDALGIGHYPGTAMPGEVGNFAIAGHRNTYGKPFAKMAELKPGDPIILRTEDTWYVYRVSEDPYVVKPHQVEVVAPVPREPEALPDRAMLTMTACHPIFSARERIIAHAELEYWAPTSLGTPKELGGGL